MNYGIKYTTSDHKECFGFSDADWAGDVSDRGFISGYLFALSGGPLTEKSKKQSCAALSTSEAEYIAQSGAAQGVSG